MGMSGSGGVGSVSEEVVRTDEGGVSRGFCVVMEERRGSEVLGGKAVV